MNKFIIQTWSDYNPKKIKQEIVFSDQDYITVGRAYNCDVILDDQYVSRQHVKIQKNDDGFIAIDLNSKNGTTLNSKPISEDNVVLSGDKIKIGHTFIRILSLDHELPPTKKFKWNNHLKDFLSSYWVASFLAIISMVIYVYLDALSTTLNNYYEEEIYEEALGIFIVFILGCFIVQISSVIDKENIKNSYVASGVSIFIFCLSLLSYGVFYASSVILDNSWQIFFSTIAYLVVIVSLIMLFTYINNGKFRLKDWIGIGFIAVLIIGISVSDIILPDKEYKLSPHYVSQLPFWSMEPKKTVSIKEFIKDSEHLF